MTKSDIDVELGRAGRAALDYVASVILALAIFALPISIAVIATGHGHGQLVIGFALACLLTTAALVRFVVARGDDLGLGSALRLLAGAGVVAWAVAVAAGVFVLGVQMSSSRCTGNGAGVVGEIGAIGIYAIAGGWALTQRRSPKLAMIVLPAAALAGVIFAG